MWATTIKVNLEPSLEPESSTTHDGEGTGRNSLVSSHMTVVPGVPSDAVVSLMVMSTLWQGLGILGFTQDCESYRPGRLLLTSPINPPV